MSHTPPTTTEAGKAHAKAANADSAAAPRGMRGLLSKGKLRLGLGLTGVLLAGWVVGCWVTRPVQLEPHDQVALALQLLDNGEYQPAQEIAQQLDKLGYQEPEFAGAVKFIQGMTTFHQVQAPLPAETNHESNHETEHKTHDEADHETVEKQPAGYPEAIGLLREAESLGMDQTRMGEWSYALGMSLYRSGDFIRARPLLEEALKSELAHRQETAMALTELYVTPGIRSPELLSEARKLTEEIIDAPGTAVEDLDQAWLRQGEVFLALSELEEAEDVLEELSEPGANSPEARLLTAQLHLAEKDYRSAVALLKPMCDDRHLAVEYSRTAGWLLGLAEDELSAELQQRADRNETEIDNHRELARDCFKQIAEQYGETAEGTACNLRLARLWREAGSHEKALECYGAALRMVRADEAYINRWLSREEFRDAVLEAWNDWLTSRKHYSEAISLAEMMTPLLPEDEAYELAARVHQRWAEEIEAELNNERYSVRMARLDEQRRQWRMSAEAFVRLAEVRENTVQYPDALWKAADHFHRCHEFSRALELINQFIATEPDRLMAAALVKRSRINLDLDQLDTAIIDLQQVLTAYPTDPSVFTAANLIGVCHYEQNCLDEAEAVWRNILTSEQLSPTAMEWRDAQLSLGRLMFEKGEVERRKAVYAQSGQTSEAVKSAYQAAQRHWLEAAALLGEYLIRNQDDERATEARYYLARSFQRQSEWFYQLFQVAETDNTRLQLERQQDQALERSLREFEIICHSLQPDAAKDRLEDVSRRLLKNANFEIPHTLYRLRRYEQAIAEYNTAANRYPNDALTLTAYIQMAQCYYHLQKPVEAGSMLATAKSMLNQRLFPDSAFEVPATNFNRDQWQEWLDRARQTP
ncbi:MAG: tetratricopeptide repeat protein [Planctomycetaceae bacterium]